MADGDMTIGQAVALLTKAIEEVRSQGFRVWGWDDGSIFVGGGELLGEQQSIGGDVD